MRNRGHPEIGLAPKKGPGLGCTHASWRCSCELYKLKDLRSSYPVLTALAVVFGGWCACVVALPM